MARYNLARGGYAPEFGKGCTDCCDIDENGLPLWLQPDQRSDGGYGYRDKVEWKQYLKMLDLRYGKTAEDLNVGDELMLFLQPNHSHLKSLFVDLREGFAGFKFELKTVNGLDLSGEQYLSTYTERHQIEQSQAAETVDTDTAQERTQWTMLIDKGYSAKVDAVVLVIKALPKAKTALQDAKILFARRFEQEGYMM
ncbi:hypothetical protein E4T80_09910 [Muribacter muris]|uniref:Uncharacterized protein n=1 Tax=Muribacter muris TaxID=67855 RepID=A0A4Y9JVS3_9PAST|nr:hypothetical protein [Muribacter muris]MBF0785773.1 hypothetical protein [Muribacter muris]MBF0828255.1 hypothetical protein [Muribacter muris]TFV08595.1 hypothetical protein E4T80_09910 [Muribacter muris]